MLLPPRLCLLRFRGPDLSGLLDPPADALYRPHHGGRERGCGCVSGWSRRRGRDWRRASRPGDAAPGAGHLRCARNIRRAGRTRAAIRGAGLHATPGVGLRRWFCVCAVPGRSPVRVPADGVRAGNGPGRHLPDGHSLVRGNVAQPSSVERRAVCDEHGRCRRWSVAGWVCAHSSDRNFGDDAGWCRRRRSGGAVRRADPRALFAANRDQ